LDFINLPEHYLSIITPSTYVKQFISLSSRTEAVALDVGTTGQVLTANSSVANGVEWANLPTTPAGSADYGVIIGTTPQNGTGTISISYRASALASDATNCIIIGTNSNCSSGASDTIILGNGHWDST